MNMNQTTRTKTKLTKEQLIQFKENGFILLRNVLDTNECQQFDKHVVQPALFKYAGIDETNPSTWMVNQDCNDRLRIMATGDMSHFSDVLPGVMVRKLPSGDDPISDEENLDLTALHSILDQLHDANINANDQDHDHDHDHDGEKIKQHSWKWLHTNVGWIHVRFPIIHDTQNQNLETTKNNPKEYDSMPNSTKIKDPMNIHQYSWHVDGNHFSPHKLDSLEQSVIILPMIRPVAVGGGNTRVLKKSHIYMAHALYKAQYKHKLNNQHTRICIHGGGIPKQITQNLNHVAMTWPDHLTSEIAPCQAGDVLLMHPFLIHTAGYAKQGHPLRVAFNMGVQWIRQPNIPIPFALASNCNNLNKQTKDAKPSIDGLSVLEDSIVWALHQNLDFMSN